ncbi:MAG: thioredoxin family protein [Magnetospiraceae bacterium]
MGRLTKICLAGATALGLIAGHPAGATESPERIEPLINDDGSPTQPWFLNSFLELPEDLQEAEAAGKRLAIIWEQRGCPYCREMHYVNFAKPEINSYIKDNFAVIQLNIWGDREVTDFDGEVVTEKNLARKWGVVFTPTIHFFGKESEIKEGQPGSAQLVAMMPGYFKPYHFISMFEYVKKDRYTSQHFQKYIDEKFRALREKGEDVIVW